MGLAFRIICLAGGIVVAHSILRNAYAAEEDFWMERFRAQGRR